MRQEERMKEVSALMSKLKFNREGINRSRAMSKEQFYF
jgi:hypothetical protein